jgi:hypothetical protein
VQATNRWGTGLVPAEVEFFRSDSWQVVVAEPGVALRAAMFIRASLLAEGGSDTRIAIGIGEVRRVVRGKVSLSSGDALTLSGHALDSMSPAFRMTIAASDAVGPLAPWLPVVACLCDSLIRLWTKRQAGIVRELLLAFPSRTHAEVADRLGVTRQNVSKSLAGAGWQSLQEALRVFEETDWGYGRGSQKWLRLK